MEYSNKNAENDYEDNIFRILYIFRRAVDEWAAQNIVVNNPKFQITYIPFLLNIDPSGISNNELAERMRVTKQGASRIAKELIACDLVMAKKNAADARSTMLYLTEKGKKFRAEAMEKTRGLTAAYLTTVGSKKFDTTIETLQKLIRFHEDIDR